MPVTNPAEHKRLLFGRPRHRKILAARPVSMPRRTVRICDAPGRETLLYRAYFDTDVGIARAIVVSKSMNTATV
jgi:hypothetical protein